MTAFALLFTSPNLNRSSRISWHFYQLSVCHRLITYALLTRPPLSSIYSIRGLPIYSSFDLHVLGTPPAFILSQDQTLNKCYLKNLSIHPNPVNGWRLSRLDSLFPNHCCFVLNCTGTYDIFVHRLSLIRSWDLISSLHCVDLLTSFYTMKLSWFCWLRLSVFKLTVLSRQLNHYSAPFLTRQALFSSFLRFLACHALVRSLVFY